MELLGLPGTIVRSLLAELRPPPDSSGLGPGWLLEHFDDGDDWVYTRCLLSDFTDMSEAEASVLSTEGRLCCWASVGMKRENGTEGWDLTVMVHRVCVRDEEECNCG
jgi:hypothetical protein